ncbi:pilus assembly protein N-terminal domain-containing protein [Burkholderia sp. Tr-862]|uniref:pilus assembly protein N-terminal domain-containing protein n=1 Tax=Burkholderia sp. Tr-862 TaxID=2608331 RepID=UPI002494E6E6|nr:pilus assembly protein N-terminal domain-containing protein [Burkholderia sp. Tr-862]
MSIATGKGEMLSLSEPATAMFVADPSIADIQVPSPRTVFVFRSDGASAARHDVAVTQ